MALSDMTISNTTVRDGAHFPIERCPTCDGAQFSSVMTSHGVAFRCGSCGTSWRIELGHLSACGEPVGMDPTGSAIC